jgi:hypothetical protein
VKYTYTSLLLPLILLPFSASAQRPDVAASATDQVATPAERRFYVGMWTFHFRDMERGLDNNWVLGMSWGKIYGATFINSFGRRAYSVGLQENVAQWRPGIVPVSSVSLGYRAGLITGYNERLFRLAGETPVLPFVQPLINLDANRLGLELSYVGVIASAVLTVRP